MSEKWVDVKNFNGLYMVSNLGNILGMKTKKILKPRITAYGYHEVGLSNGSFRKSKTVHRIVSEAFLIKHEASLVVNHIDGNKFNNKVSNLEWVTQKENVHHSFRTGLRVTGKGDSSPHHKLTEETVYKIKEMLTNGHKNIEIVRRLNVNPWNVMDIKLGKSWSWLKLKTNEIE